MLSLKIFATALDLLQDVVHVVVDWPRHARDHHAKEVWQIFVLHRLVADQQRPLPGHGLLDLGRDGSQFRTVNIKIKPVCAILMVAILRSISQGWRQVDEADIGTRRRVDNQLEVAPAPDFIRQIFRLKIHDFFIFIKKLVKLLVVPDQRRCRRDLRSSARPGP